MVRFFVQFSYFDVGCFGVFLLFVLLLVGWLV